MNHKVYTEYRVVASFDRSDTMNTQYREFQGNVLKYGQDGISCVDAQNKLIWSQTYNMQNPVVDVCEKSAAVAEKNGTEAFIFDEKRICRKRTDDASYPGDFGVLPRSVGSASG